MKKILLLLLGVIVLTNCKNDSKEENVKTPTETIDVDSPERTEKQSDGLTMLKGDFVYYADAAVLQTHKEVYAVVIDDKMHELDELAKKYKKQPTDYVTVVIRGKITPKPEGEEGWPFRVEIKEVVDISASDPESNNVVKLESK
jgi:hypothetical protein